MRWTVVEALSGEGRVALVDSLAGAAGCTQRGKIEPIRTWLECPHPASRVNFGGCGASATDLEFGVTGDLAAQIYAQRQRILLEQRRAQPDHIGKLHARVRSRRRQRCARHLEVTRTRQDRFASKLMVSEEELAAIERNVPVPVPAICIRNPAVEQWMWSGGDLFYWRTV